MDPFADLIAGLTSDPEPATDELARYDHGRHARKGVPEVIYAPGKTRETVERLVAEVLDRSGRVIVSRPADDARASLVARYAATHRLSGRWSLAIEDPDHPSPPTGGRVGVITAGTSDAPYAEEAVLVARHMGCEVREVYDVGVAGLHRLFPPLRAVLESDVDTIVVAAGMDGALPSVVAGLVRVPVIGLPTSTGYGAGGRGVAALLSMLQTCAPGLAVVNIDNGVGAGAVAALIANRAAEARRKGE